MHVGIAHPRWQGKRSRHYGACATLNFTHLVRGPWSLQFNRAENGELEVVWMVNQCVQGKRDVLKCLNRVDTPLGRNPLLLFLQLPRQLLTQEICLKWRSNVVEMRVLSQRKLSCVRVINSAWTKLMKYFEVIINCIFAWSRNYTGFLSWPIFVWKWTPGHQQS